MAEAGSDGTFSHVFTRHHVFSKASPGKIDQFYEMGKTKLGEGSYGSVCKAKAKGTKDIRAIKSIKLEKVKDLTRFEEEVKIQQSLDHPSIVKLYEVYQDARCCYLVMELCTGGELFDRIIAQTELSDNGMAFGEKDAAVYMTQILGAMNYLHKKNFVHRDIKPENFLMEDDKPTAQCKVIDFGLAKKYKEGDPLMMTQAGTPYYVAPEVLFGKGYTEKCDVWSSGVICYILMCGYPPFYGDSDKEILTMVKKGKFDYPSPDWDSTSETCKTFIRSMFTFDYAKRPSFEDLLNSDWITKNDHAEGKVAADLGHRLKSFRGTSKLKKLALTCIAKQLDDSAMEELKTTFMTLDVNKDGTLTVKEILDGMKKHNVKIDDDLPLDLEKLDTDGSGSIDYLEFMAATLTKAQLDSDEALWSAFRVFDLDGDGEITYAELKQVSGAGVAEDEIAKMLNEGDLDGDGTISFNEFKKLIRG